MMRILGGDLKGRALKGPPGSFVRPLAARARKSLFDTLGPERIAIDWLDLFAGTGSVGIEALSRGACHCDFVDHHPAACRVLEANLGGLGLLGRGRVVRQDAMQALQRRCQAGAYGIVFAGPPFGEGLPARVVRGLDLAYQTGGVGLVIVQHERLEDPGNGGKGLQRLECRKIGDSFLSYYAHGATWAESISPRI